MALPTLSGGTYRPAASRQKAATRPAPKPRAAAPQATRQKAATRPTPKAPAAAPSTHGAAPASRQLRTAAVVTAPAATHATVGAGTYVTPKPSIPGHESRYTPVVVTPAKPGPKPAQRTAPTPAPRRGTTGRAAPPAVTKPAAPRPAPKAPGGKPPMATNSPAPGAGAAMAGGSFDLASLLPIILIAGAILAGIYLYSHRKGA